MKMGSVLLWTFPVKMLTEACRVWEVTCYLWALTQLASSVMIAVLNSLPWEKCISLMTLKLFGNGLITHLGWTGIKNCSCEFIAVSTLGIVLTHTLMQTAKTAFMEGAFTFLGSTWLMLDLQTPLDASVSFSAYTVEDRRHQLEENTLTLSFRRTNRLSSLVFPVGGGGWGVVTLNGKTGKQTYIGDGQKSRNKTITSGTSADLYNDCKWITTCVLLLQKSQNYRLSLGFSRVSFSDDSHTLQEISFNPFKGHLWLCFFVFTHLCGCFWCLICTFSYPLEEASTVVSVVQWCPYHRPGREIKKQKKPNIFPRFY